MMQIHIMLLIGLIWPICASSPGDKKIAQTVIWIIEEFFRQNPDILLYMCSMDGGQQAQRSRLFLRWFNGAEQQKHYVIRATEVKGEKGLEYVAAIIQRNNPHLNEIISLFDADITMFNEMKPWFPFHFFVRWLAHHLPVTGWMIGKN